MSTHHYPYAPPPQHLDDAGVVRMYRRLHDQHQALRSAQLQVSELEATHSELAAEPSPASLRHDGRAARSRGRLLAGLGGSTLVAIATTAKVALLLTGSGVAEVLNISMGSAVGLFLGASVGASVGTMMNGLVRIAGARRLLKRADRIEVKQERARSLMTDRFGQGSERGQQIATVERQLDGVANEALMRITALGYQPPFAPSAGNVADHRAFAEELEVLDVPGRYSGRTLLTPGPGLGMPQMYREYAPEL